VSGSLLAFKFCGFGKAGQRWLVQLKPDPLGRSTMFSRVLAAAGALAFVVAAALGSRWGVPGSSLWMVDATAAVGFLFYAISPERVLRLVPLEATFDWAGARGQGVPAPADAKFTYPFRLVVTAVLGALIIARANFSGGALLFPSPALEPQMVAAPALFASLIGTVLLWWGFFKTARSSRPAA